MGPDSHDYFPPAKRDIGVVPLFFGNFAYFVCE